MLVVGCRMPLLFLLLCQGKTPRRSWSYARFTVFALSAVSCIAAGNPGREKGGGGEGAGGGGGGGKPEQAH